MACPESTSARWQRGDGNTACHAPAPLSLYLWKFRCRHSLPPSRSSSWDQLHPGGSTGPWLAQEQALGLWAPRASWPFKPHPGFSGGGFSLPASSRMTCCLHPLPLPAISLHRTHLLPESSFQMNLFWIHKRQEQPFDLNKAHAVSLRSAWNHFRLIISDNLQMFVNFLKEEEEVAQLCLPPTRERRLSLCLAAMSLPGEFRSLDLLRRSDFR